MSRQQELTVELGEARVRITRLEGELAGERRASRTIATELAAHAAAVGADAGRREAASERARGDAIVLRRLLAEHVVAVRAGMDPLICATSLLDQAMVRGISLTHELDRAAADRAVRDATAAAVAGGSDAAAATIAAPAPAADRTPLDTTAPAAPPAR